jgi:hypothetical protein
MTRFSSKNSWDGQTFPTEELPETIKIEEIDMLEAVEETDMDEVCDRCGDDACDGSSCEDD